MGNRLSIGAALNEAFLFGVKRWWTVLRLSWAPVIAFIFIVLAALFGVTSFSGSLENFANAAHEVDPTEYLRVSPFLAVIIIAAAFLAGFVLLAGVAASIYRLVALGEERPGIFDLRMDGPAMRVFFAHLILGMIQIAIWIGAFIIAFGLHGTSLGDLVDLFGRLFSLAAEEGDISSDQAAELGRALSSPFATIGSAVLIAIVPLIYFGVKLTPFPAGSAAENRLLLFGSMRLTSGNFWRIFATYVLYLIAIMLTSIVFEIAVQAFSLAATAIAVTGGVFAPLGALLGVLLGAAIIVYQSFVYGTQLALQAIIYRQLEYGE